VIPSRETLLELQARHRFSARYLEIVLRLRELLHVIGQDKSLTGSLVLKGGTALNLCFGAPPRLSVDLDLNYVGALDLRQMKEARPQKISALERIARRTGYRIQSSAEEHAGKRLYLRYTSALGGEGTLQVDVNFLHRISLGPIQELPVWSPAEADVVIAGVVSSSELIAGKAVALIDRVAARDLYDIYYLQKRGSTFNLGREARAMFIAMSGVLSQPLTRYALDRLERVTDDAVRDTLHPLLRQDERPGAEELRKGAGQVMGPWLQLSAGEKEYAERLQRGELHPELLFPHDPMMAERLRQHPALLWKAKNAGSAARRASRSKK
jgi:hypothetical protein